MLVRELIAMLQKHDMDAVVVIPIAQDVFSPVGGYDSGIYTEEGFDEGIGTFYRDEDLPAELEEDLGLGEPQVEEEMAVVLWSLV